MNAEQSAVSSGLWTVSHVYFIGVAKNPFGEATTLLNFKAELQSAESRCVVEIQIDALTLNRLLKQLEQTGKKSHRNPNHGAQPRTITKLIEELLTLDLSFDGSNYWDPVRFPRWQLQEEAIARHTEDAVKGNKSERHLSPRFLTFVGNLLRST